MNIEQENFINSIKLMEFDQIKIILEEETKMISALTDEVLVSLTLFYYRKQYFELNLTTEKNAIDFCKNELLKRKPLFFNKLEIDSYFWHHENYMQIEFTLKMYLAIRGDIPSLSE